MSKMNLSRTGGFLVALLSLAAPICAESVVVLVRHAEKSGSSGDVPLTKVGKQRAAALADLLVDAGIEAVYSTDTIRTRETARPVAKKLGLELRLYDGSKLEELAAELRGSNRRVLVVGHSNTTPELVELLGGEPGRPYTEDEYDRLYVLTLGSGEGAVTTLLRFSP